MSIPLRTTYLLIRSKDAIQLTAGLNTHFQVNLVSPIVANQGEEIHTSIISASIPHSFYAVSSNLGNNTIVYDNTHIFTLPSQNYDPKELIRVINVDPLFPFTASYNRYTNKVSFTNKTLVSHTLNWTLSGANKVVGYGSDSDMVVLPSATTTSSSMLDLATIHALMIRSDIAQSNTLSTRTGNSTILQKINVDSTPYGLVYIDGTDTKTHSITQAGRIDTITMQIEDQEGRIIDLLNINYELTLQFDIYPISPEAVKPMSYLDFQASATNLLQPTQQPNYNPYSTNMPIPTLLPISPEDQKIDANDETSQATIMDLILQTAA